MGKGTGKKIAAGAVIAGAVGYVAGILTAPKSGKDTRKDIHDAAVKARTAAEKELKKLYSELNDLINQSRSKAEEARIKAKAGYDKALSGAKDAQAKAKEMLSAVHNGDADDRDLDRAVKEAAKALGHLKTYLKK